MRLTNQTDYALRTLMFLATRGERATIDQIAGLFAISANHVAKVVNQLAKQGYVRSIRGIGGGVELARPAESISVGEIIQAFEGTQHLLDCIGTDNVCAIQSFCKLKGVLKTAESMQMEYLKSVPLAQVIPRPRELDGVQNGKT